MASAARRSRFRTRAWLALATLLAVALGVVIWRWDWNWFKPAIERQVAQASGRSFVIQGPLDVDPGWRVWRLTAAGLRLGNPAWASETHMLKAERVDLDIAFWPALIGDLAIDHARLVGASLHLERQPGHRGNWLLREAEARVEANSPPPFSLHRLSIERSALSWVDAEADSALQLDMETTEADAGQLNAPLKLSGSGRFRGFPFDLSGTVGSPLALRDRATPYQIDVRATAGDTQAHARGEIGLEALLQEFSLDLELQGTTLADLYPLFDLALPATPPYSLQGRLQREGAVWTYDGFSGRVGDSDLSGNSVIDFSASRPHMQADLHSSRLDFDDLAGLVGAPPQSGRGETASAEQQQQAAELRASERVLPQRRYNLTKLRSMDAEVTLQAADVQAQPLPISGLRVHLQLQDGHLRAEPLHFDVAGGSVEGHVELDARQDPIRIRTQLDARGLRLPRLFPTVDLTADSAGRVGGQFDLQGRGNSIAAMLANADGSARLLMGRGHISNLLLELAGLDVAEALGFLLGQDQHVPIRCAYASLQLEEGIATVEQLAFDSSDTVLHGEGEIDLREERIDLTLRPRPKDPSLIALRSPLSVSGRFKDPDVAPQPVPLALRGLAAAALYAIAPPATLLALIETGPGKDTGCGSEIDAEAA